MSRKYSSYLLLALLVLSTIAVAVPLLSTPAAAAGKSAWLKIVTSAWKGTTCKAIYDGIDSGFAGDSPSVTTPMCIDPSVTGFADRFNITSLEAYVEVYTIKPEWAFQSEGKFEPNATGFVKISWDAPDDWGLLVLVKAKSYYGEKIGEGEALDGIIMYALLIPPRNPSAEALKHIKELTGLNTTANADDTLKANFTINDDGILDKHPGYFDFNLSRAGLGSGPFDYLNGTSVDLGSFAEIFGNETDSGTPVNAWIARAAKMFKVFHVHSWYDIKDNLSFAQVKIYDLDHTDADSEESLIQACVTAVDGQCRYTREIYPADALDYRDYWENNLVPIPLQIFNLENKTVYHGGIVHPGTDGGAIGAPKLNATVRVWWETVIVNQTIYYGYEYNGTGSHPYVDDLNKRRPSFVGPFSMALNNTITVSGTGRRGIWVDKTHPRSNRTDVANFINATVFYAKFCVQDADMEIQHPLVGDKMVGAKLTFNLKTEDDRAYYMTKNLPTTDRGGCTSTPHKYRGGYDGGSFTIDGTSLKSLGMSRFPNATMWLALYVDEDDNGIPDYFDKREIRSFWEEFGDDVWLNASLAYYPGDADNYDDIPEGPKLEDAKSPLRIGDEDVEKIYDGNWSKLVADISYANTLTLTDDKEYDGFDAIVKWKGGYQNNYDTAEKIVDVIRVKNPYAIALRFGGNWMLASATTTNNKLWLRIDSSEYLNINYAGGETTTINDFEGTIETVNHTSVYMYSAMAGVPAWIITVVDEDNGNMTVNVIENTTAVPNYRKV
ncbi:MAG: hypothetical protein J7L79_02030, partial [Thaumarchaeota archaeon]|nr:hypothetical protein [Nitrososphaerota archaeon]